MNKKILYIVEIILLGLLFNITNVNASITVDGVELEDKGNNTYLYSIFEEKDIIKINANDKNYIVLVEYLRDGINFVNGDGYKLLIYKQSFNYEQLDNLEKIEEDSYFNTLSSTTITDSILEGLNKYSFEYNLLDEQGGLLENYKLSSFSSSSGSFTPIISNISGDYYYNNLPEGTEVIYFTGDKYIGEKVYVCSYDEKTHKHEVLSTNSNNRGYAHFTANGSTKIFITNEDGLNFLNMNNLRRIIYIIELSIIAGLLLVITIRLLLTRI